jgi:hypothetical protein
MSENENPESETRRYVQRGDKLAHGSRSGAERRHAERGLRPGRRYEDHQRARREFIDRILDMRIQGCSAHTTANILNDEAIETAEGKEWTKEAIQQLLDTEDSRRARDAWRPLLRKKTE